MGTTPPTHACAVRFMNFGAETKFEKGASDRNSHPGIGLAPDLPFFAKVGLHPTSSLEGTFAKGDGGQNVREGMFARECSQGATGDRTFARGHSRGATFRATVSSYQKA